MRPPGEGFDWHNTLAIDWPVVMCKLKPAAFQPASQSAITLDNLCSESGPEPQIL